MPIEFSAERWEKIREDTRAWWQGKLNRPLVQVRVVDAPARRPEPRANDPDKNKVCYDLSIPPEDVIDRWDYELSRQRYLGDAYPHVFVDFGPGVAAAFMGARPDPRRESVWFHAPKEQPIAEVHLAYDPDNVWRRRIADIYRAGLERWGSSVLMSMTDLGGNLDIVSSFRPAEGLLFDLVDHPDDVKRVTWEAHDLWWRYFEEFNAILHPASPGHSAWAPIYSDVPFYILQCDFCYMIGPEMFEEFVLPELAATCRKLGNSIYHLDGVGQLKQLDLLLAIPELKGIQWVPGAGKPRQEDWPDVLRKVLDAGKLVQISGDAGTIDNLVKSVGTAKGILVTMRCSMSEQKQYEAMLKKCGAL